jgi:hypothetical protein
MELLAGITEGKIQAGFHIHFFRHANCILSHTVVATSRFFPQGEIVKLQDKQLLNIFTEGTSSGHVHCFAMRV